MASRWLSSITRIHRMRWKMHWVPCARWPTRVADVWSWFLAVVVIAIKASVRKWGGVAEQRADHALVTSDNPRSEAPQSDHR